MASLFKSDFCLVLHSWSRHIAVRFPSMLYLVPSLWHFVIGMFLVSFAVATHIFGMFGISLESLSSPTLRLYGLVGLTPCLTSVGGHYTHSQPIRALLALAPVIGWK